MSQRKPSRKAPRNPKLALHTQSDKFKPLDHTTTWKATDEEQEGVKKFSAADDLKRQQQVALDKQQRAEDNKRVWERAAERKVQEDLREEQKRADDKAKEEAAKKPNAKTPAPKKH